MVANGNETKSSDLDLIAAARREAATLPRHTDHTVPATDSFPGYDLIGEIHRGAQGVVYRALQKSTRREVAIKVMREGPFAGPHDRARFEREVQILGQLKHPNIVAIHDSGQAAGHFYFVMDFIPGESLDLHMAGDRMSVDDALKLFGKICDAVNAAHLKGVIHRDLKPGNICIDPDGEPHVLDFGLAKLAPNGLGGGSSKQAMTLTGQFIGSLPWASPEQASGRPDQIDMRTDVYSLGVILYQMLTGQFPYEVIGNMRDVLDNILRAEPSRPSTLRRQINNEVETIILKCLQKERERRYQSAGELSRDVKHYFNGEPIEAKRDSGWYILRKSLTRHRGKIAGVGIVAALVIAFAVYAYVQKASELDLAQERLAYEKALRLVTEGRKLEGVTRRSEALVKYDLALQLVPDLYEAIGYKAFFLKSEYFGKKYSFRGPELLEQSLELCERALGIKPDRPGLWNLKSVLLYSLGDLEGAEQASRRVITFHPGYHYAYSNLGRILALQHRFEEALDAVEDGVAVASEKKELGKYDDGLWRTLGTLQLHWEQAEAVTTLTKAREMDSRDNRNWLMLARLHLMLAGHIDNEAALEQAKLAYTATQLRDPRFDRILAQAHLANNEYTDAIRHAEAAIDGEDRAAYCHLIASIANAHLGESDLANDHLAQALGNWPAEFDEDDVIVTAEKGLLWFDTLAELQALHAEAEQAIRER